MTKIGLEKLDVLDRRDVYDFFTHIIDESELHNKSFNARTVIVQKVEQWGNKEHETMMNISVQFDIMVNGEQHKWLYKKSRAFSHSCSHQEMHEVTCSGCKGSGKNSVLIDGEIEETPCEVCSGDGIQGAE